MLKSAVSTISRSVVELKGVFITRNWNFDPK